MLNLSELTDKVRALAIEAGDFIREERKAEFNLQMQQNSD